MFTRLTTAALFALAGTGAFAVPITITPYNTGTAINDALDGYTSGTIVQETFERFGSDPDNGTVLFESGTISREASPGINFGELTNVGINTLVGQITTYGSLTGSGNTCQNLDLNNDNCSNIALQYSPDLNGQGNIVPLGGAWSLNAADTGGFFWEAVSILTPTINKIVFALRDAADQGATVSVSTTVGGVVYSEARSGLGNENLQLIEIDFGLSGVTSADIIISSSKRNDSMTIDGLTLVGPLVGGGNETPPVPLPATGLLLLGGVGALALGRRRKASS